MINNFCLSAKQINKQNGATSFISVMIILLVSATFLFSVLDSTSIKIERNKRTAVVLAEAKAALIGYMVKRTALGERPGDLPCPDKATDGNYDGTQDSSCASSRIGKFPWSNVDHLGVFNDGIALDLTDANGERLWYAVSRNLVDPTNVPINSDLLAAIPPYPWLSVYDTRGNLITNRAVAVIISPGNVLVGQDRSPVLPNAAQYLDQVTLNAVVYNNAASSPTKFISGLIYDALDPAKVIANDEVIFITIDEVLPLIEARVIREAKKCLDDYSKSNSGNYPWAAPASDIVFFTSTVNTRFGRLPRATFVSSSCDITQGWWVDWRNFVFYAFPDSHKLGSTTNCSVAGDCLKINGGGANTAVVLIGRNAIGTQIHSPVSSNTFANNFLDGSNASITSNYLTYKSSDTANYSTINDLVLCLDGQINCK
ncbi:MAG: hypothetical protein WC696_10325 [Candidatus Methylopumilus sp.]